MDKRERLENKWNSLMFNHLWLKYIVEYGFALIMTLLSAIIFAFGFNAFLDPAALDAGKGLVSGGASGFSQIFSSLSILFGADANTASTVRIIVYVGMNIPIAIIAFKGIGKRFGLFTVINVVAVAIFMRVFENIEFVNRLSIFVDGEAGMLGRALFAGLCTGISSALAFKIESSAGGFDVISYYLSLKKGSNTGPFVAVINGTILIVYTIINVISSNGAWDMAIARVFFSLVYLFTVVLLIDLINVRNKKAQVEIITNDENLPNLLLANIPHGATLLKGKGVYSGKDRFVIHMIVSTTEVKKVIKVVKQIDPESFVNVTTLQQVYGRFHMKPIK